MNEDLERYMNEHLAGSRVAVSTIGDLADRQEDPGEKRFFLELKAEVEKDQALLMDLLEDAGLAESTALRIAGEVTAKAGRLKLIWEGFEPGELGMFEALEMLALGIQGKRLLWVMLGEIAPDYPAWSDVSFADLELDAIRQRDEVEARRVKTGRESFHGIG